MRCRHAAGGLVGMMAVTVAALAALVALVVVAAAIVAYLKRETWTLPAYRKARDRTGEWSVTPWSAGPPVGGSDAGSSQPEEAAETPLEATEATA